MRKQLKQHGEHLRLAALAVVPVPYAAPTPVTSNPGLYVTYQPVNHHIGQVTAHYAVVPVTQKALVEIGGAYSY